MQSRGYSIKLNLNVLVFVVSANYTKTLAATPSCMFMLCH